MARKRKQVKRGRKHIAGPVAKVRTYRTPEELAADFGQGSPLVQIATADARAAARRDLEHFRIDLEHFRIFSERDWLGAFVAWLYADPAHEDTFLHNCPGDL